MKPQIQIDIDILDAIVSAAKLIRAHDSSLSNIVSLTLVKGCDSHNGSDKIEAWIKSGYSECQGRQIL